MDNVIQIGDIVVFKNPTDSGTSFIGWVLEKTRHPREIIVLGTFLGKPFKSWNVTLDEIRKLC